MKSHPASYHLLGVCVNFLYTVPFVLSFFQVSAYIAMGICFPLHSVLCTLTVIINYTYLELFAFVAFAMLCIEFRALHIVCCATWPYPQPLDIFSLSPFLPLSFVPGLESRASCILSYDSATELHSSCPSSPSPQKKAFIVKTCWDESPEGGLWRTFDNPQEPDCYMPWCCRWHCHLQSLASLPCFPVLKQQVHFRYVLVCWFGKRVETLLLIVCWSCLS